MNSKPMTIAIVACAIAWTMSLNTFAQETRYAPRIGEPHLDFVLPTINDKTPIRLSDYRGKKVLLIHFASW